MDRLPILRAAAAGLFVAAGLSALAIEVDLVEPRPGVPLVDAVEIVVEIRSADPLRHVELLVDGETVHRWTAEPYRVVYDFGLSGWSRSLEVRVLSVDGTEGRTVLVSPAVEIDELVDLELQQLYVTVEDRWGRRELGLGREVFKVLDSGREEELVTFAVGRIPFTATLLVDASDSMRGHRLESAMAGVGRFIGGMRDLDRAQLIAFADRVLARTPVGARRELEAAGPQPFVPGGGTAIRDHLFVASRLLEPRQGRRAVVLLSDGWDQLSVISGRELESVLERSQSTIYWVRLAGDEPTSRLRAELRVAWGDSFADLRYRFHPAPTSWVDQGGARKAYRELEDLVALTGGRILTAESISGIEEAMREVLAELHEQYALGYYPQLRGIVGEWRPVDVRLDVRGLKVRTRAGYVEQ